MLTLGMSKWYINQFGRIVRPFRELMTDVDEAKTVQEVGMIVDELIDNKHEYPLTQLWFAKDHVEAKVKKLIGPKEKP